MSLTGAHHAAAAGGFLGGGKLGGNEQGGDVVELLFLRVPDSFPNAALAEIECPNGAHKRKL